MPSTDQPRARPPFPTRREALRVWLRIAMLSFGGPAGQIAVMHRILVEEKRWIGERRFLHALNFCMLLPGPEAQQLVTYIGWLLHRTWGGLVAGILFVLPGLVAIMALSWIYALHGDSGLVESLFFGIKAGVLAVVLHALLRIASRALRGPLMAGIALASFVAIYAYNIPFPLIIVGAGVFGFVAARAGYLSAQSPGHDSSGGALLSDADSALGSELPAHARGEGWYTLRLALILLAAWLLPSLLLLWLLGPDSVFTDIGLFFSQMAVVTFGGAYAVLAWVAQAAVGHYGWLEAGEMLDGLGMAETTPGPLIMVTQFVGFMAAFRDPGVLHPLLAGTLGGLLTTWVTFTPCFLWIFLGAPHVERLRANIALSAAMAAITAAVVGVILNLALWFALHTLFEQIQVFGGLGMRMSVPEFDSLRPLAALLAAAAIYAAFRMQVGMITLLLASGISGVMLYLLGLL